MSEEGSITHGQLLELSSIKQYEYMKSGTELATVYTVSTSNTKSQRSGN